MHRRIMRIICLPALIVPLAIVASVSLSVPLRAQRAVAARTTSNEAKTVLASPVTIHLDDVPLNRALDSISARAGVPIQYQYRQIRANDRRVTLHVTKRPLGVVLETALTGTHLGVSSVIDGVVTIADAARATSADSGFVTGVVTDAKTKQPLRNVSVLLDDTAKTRTNDVGRYRISNLSPGQHRVTVRLVGYVRQMRLVTVGEEQSATADFVLGSSVNSLDQVVVTATGAQRYRELGHVVATINADSLVKEAPITNFTDLLQSRVPGLLVLTGEGGDVGGSVQLRLRGTSTYNLDPEPIVIVDGIRYQSNNYIEHGGKMIQDFRGNRGDLQSPLNNLNPNDIASIEVVKGPSASTLYGPDAANGVIVVTTKRGAPGTTKFSWYARPVTNSVPKTRVERGYQIWSHDSTGALFDGSCNLVYQYQYHVCTLDSITVASAAVTNDKYSVLAKSRPSWQYGATVSGGVSQFTYFLSGNYDSQLGALRLAPALQEYLSSHLGLHSLSDAIRNPNSLKSVGTHANIGTNLGSKGTLQLTVGYDQSDHYMAQPGVFTSQVDRGVPRPTIDTTDVGNYIGNPLFSLQTTQENNNRFTGALQGTYQLLPWWNVTALVGLDLNGTVQHSILPAQQASPTDGGNAQDDRRNNIERTLNLGTGASTNIGGVSFRTSLGVQYHYSHLDGVSLTGQNLAPGSTSIGTATQLQSTQVWSEQVSLGTYGEEVVGLRDNRVFLTGSLRLDGSTSFGDAYHAHPYPKVGASWVASEEPFLKDIPGLRELRFRSSFGASSKYPTSVMKVGELQGYPVPIEGQNQNVFDRTSLANQSIRPERTREGEYGFDLTVPRDVTFQLTWNRRQTDDQLLLIANAYGLAPQYVNGGDMKAHGFEATVQVPLVDARNFRAALGLTYSVQRSQILSLGSVPEQRTFDGSGAVVGFPIGSVFSVGQRVVGVADTVGGHADGIIFDNEIVFDTSQAQRFVGLSDPPKTYTASPNITLFGGHVRVSSVFDRQTGFVRYNQRLAYCQSTVICLAPFLLSTPVLEQARFQVPQGVNFLESGDFTRWREFSISTTIPSRFLKIDPLRLHFSSATVSLQGRNLALWTNFGGSDPESRVSSLSNIGSNGAPQARSWSFRFDIIP